MDAPHGLKEKRDALMGTKQECYVLFWNSSPQKSNRTITYHPSQKPSKWDQQDMLSTAEGVRKTIWVIFFSYGHPLIDTRVLADQQGITFMSHADALWSQGDLTEVMNKNDWGWEKRDRERWDPELAVQHDD